MQQVYKVSHIQKGVRPDMVQGEHSDTHQVGQRPVPAADNAEKPRPENTLLHDGRHEHRHSRDLPEFYTRHAEHSLIVGVVTQTQRQHHAVHKNIAAPHDAVGDADLQNAGPGPVAQGVKIPAEEAPQENEHIGRAHRVAQEVCLGLVQLSPEQQRGSQQRQQQHMHRQIDKRGNGLPSGQTACEFNSFSVHHPLAFFCSSKSRFMASMGVRVFRSVSRRMRLTSSAPTSAKLIWSSAAFAVWN